MPVEHHVRLGQVGTRAHDDAGSIEQVGLVVAQLAEEDPLLLGGAVLGQRREVEEEHEHAGPLDVAEELVPEPAPLAGPLDEAGEVGDDELGLVVEPHHAEVRLERRERVVGDLRLGGGDGGDERGLPDAREPHEGHVGHQLELEPQPVLLADLALLGEGRRAPAVRQEAGVAPAAPPALGGQPAVARVEQVGQIGAVLVAHHRALGHRHLDVGATPPVLPLALSVGPALGGAVGVVLERDQGRHVAVDHEPHAPAGATVAPVGAAEGDVRLPAEADRAGTAVATLDVETTLIDELRHPARLPSALVGDENRLLR